MRRIISKIKKYKEEKKLTDEKVAKKLDISLEDYTKIMETGEIDDEALFRKIDTILAAKKIKRSEKIRRLIELIIRITGIVTSISALLVCLAGKQYYDHVIVLLVISAICTSTLLLPKNK